MEFAPGNQTTPYEARRFTEFLHARFTGVAPSGIVSGKIPRKAFLKSFGIKVPETLMEFCGPDAIDFAKLPPRFVLKPVNLCFCQGVYLLERQGGHFFELIRQKHFTPEEVIADLKAVFESLKLAETPMFAEELVVGENGAMQIPLDYKFWMFGETIGAILQVNRNTHPNEITHLNSGFAPMPEGKIIPGTRPQGVPVLPANAATMIEAAKKISRQLETPFCSVDLYTTGQDVYFGELSPTPGVPYYGRIFRLSEGFDFYLGSLWKEGCLQRGLPIPQITSPPPVLVT
ncbi:MAG: ATP-grasp fold amidoligase family protein [Terrimicrobiaceae bacterium]